MKIKKLIFEILYTPPGKKGIIYLIDDVFINILILLNAVAIVLDSFSSVRNVYQEELKCFELFSIIIFSVEYILRLWVSDLKYPELPKWKARLKYIFSFMGLIDLCAILPFYINYYTDFIALRAFRLFRIFKLSYYSASFQLLGEVIVKKKRELLITVFGAVIIVFISSSLMYEIESQYQPEAFSNIVTTFWWAVATLMTIGYGDVVPITPAGKILASITAIFGVGIVAIPTGLISVGFIEELTKKNKERDNKINYCPYCGKKLPEI